MEQLVSVIVPVYKVEEYLDKCVESIVNQTYKNLEIILVDDGSPDSCPELCDKWAERDSRVKTIHKKNNGVSSARNSALDIAKGEYIAFVDSDDYVENTFISNLINGFSDENIGISICGLFDNEKKVSAESQMTAESNKARIMLFNMKDYPYFEGYIWNKLYKQEVINKAHLRFDTSLRMCEDTLFNFEYLKHIDNVCLVPTADYHYCYRSDSVMRVKPIQNDFDMIPLIDKFLGDSDAEALSDMIVIWSFKYWIKAIDDYIVTKTGKDYYVNSIEKIKKYKKILLKSAYTSKVEKLFVVLINSFKLIYFAFKKLRLGK